MYIGRMLKSVCLQTPFFVVRKMALLFVVLCFCSCVEKDVSRGNDALRIGDYERSTVNFSKALDEEPANRDARYGLALSYYALAEERERLRVRALDLWEKAVNEFRILSKVDSSGKIDAAYSTSLFYLARAMLAEQGRANVLPLLDHSIMLDSLNYFSLNLKALLLERQGEFEKSKKIYAYIVTKEPKFSSAYVNLGNLYWKLGDIESAWDIWSMGHVAIPDDATLLRWTEIAEDSLKALVEKGEL